MDNANKKGKINWLTILGLCLILIAVFLAIIFFLKGKTTVTGDLMVDAETVSLVCVGEEKDYPFFRNLGAKSKIATVTVLFYDNKFKSIALNYSVSFDDVASMKSDASLSQAAMNQSFSNSGFGAGAFQADYSENGNNYIVSLYASQSSFENSAGKYFYASELSKDSDYSDFKGNYELQGFSCTK